MSPSLTPLTIDQRTQFVRALRVTRVLVDSPLSQLAWAPHLIWSDQFRYFWMEQKGWWGLFAEYPDGIYMPLPPLGPLNADDRISPLHLSYEEAFHVVFKEMETKNKRKAVTRIENIPEELRPKYEAYGYRLCEKYPDYLYRTNDLIRLKGDRYKSQRRECNRFLRVGKASLEPFQSTDQKSCLTLFEKWAAKKLEGNEPGNRVGEEWLNEAMLEESRPAHRLAMSHDKEWGLIGRVLRIQGEICGYTFGYERNPEVWCVLLEVADRTIPGLAQYLFRECCRELD